MFQSNCLSHKLSGVGEEIICAGTIMGWNRYKDEEN